MTTNPNDPKLKKLKDNGQQEDYLVLPKEVIEQGLVRPIRFKYIHSVCGVETRMSDEIAHTYARNPKFYGATFCVGCKSHFPLKDAKGNPQFFWSDTEIGVGD